MTTIEINETIVGMFAHQQDAVEVGAILLEKGWPVVYLEPDAGEPRWQFDTLADMRRFWRDWEDVIDDLGHNGTLTTAWECDCEEDGCDPCPHGDDPRAEWVAPPPPADWEHVSDELKPLTELYGAALRARINEMHPGLQEWLCASLDALYGAIAFGHECEETALLGSAALMWLRDRWQRDDSLRTYDQHLDDLAAFVEFASHDAWMSERLASAGLQPADLSWCETCEELAPLNCECEGGDIAR